MKHERVFVALVKELANGIAEPGFAEPRATHTTGLCWNVAASAATP